MIENSYELYRLLEAEGLLQTKPPMWWPAYGEFEVVVGAILTQNAQWSRVECSLENLRQQGALELESFVRLSLGKLEELISPSGLFRSKAKYLSLLTQAIHAEYGDYDSFCENVDREWLLRQKGIGPESADSILCYGCKRPQMVVDAYTARLLRAFGYEFDSYEALQEWCVRGLEEKFESQQYANIYALFHGMIVEYVKANSKAKVVNIDRLIHKDKT